MNWVKETKAASGILFEGEEEKRMEKAGRGSGLVRL